MARLKRLLHTGAAIRSLDVKSTTPDGHSITEVYVHLSMRLREEGGVRVGFFIVPLAILALLLTSGAIPGAVHSPASASTPPSDLSTASDSSSYLYFNGTEHGNGIQQNVYLPTPPNGTVWDLVSASVSITATSAVPTTEVADLYDSTCTQLDIAPGDSNCKGIWGPNVDTIVNDVMVEGKSGTNTGSGGYSATEPSGLVQYEHWWQTIHLTYDSFWTFEWLLSDGVSATYHVVMDPEIGDYPSYAFYRWGNPVSPLSSTPKTVTIPGPPAGYYYRAEMAVATIDLGDNSLTPTRSAEILEEPSATLLTQIDKWTVTGPGVTEDGCGGYSSAQSCTSDPTGTGIVWESPVLITSSESLEVRFVGVSGDVGVFGIVVTKYPAATGAPPAPTGLHELSGTASSLTWTWTNPSGTLTDDYFFWEAGKTCSSPTEVNLGAVSDSYVVSSLASATWYCAYVKAASAGGTSAASSLSLGETWA